MSVAIRNRLASGFRSSLRAGRTIAEAARTYENLTEEKKKLVRDGLTHKLASKKLYQRKYTNGRERHPIHPILGF